ncbi:hypothetical protein SAMN05444126_1134 [Salisediminibacterium halotolerans]|uniref:Uncharacterized protein n=1 Tax=Salisediminibacterium halotolerans TaxID=517425 RepID=A0A1H9U739_9BACI|nr:hypothetical protein SAMN05444126_1134 [Salisediminibacterium haloalkalitolerans]
MSIETLNKIKIMLIVSVCVSVIWSTVNNISRIGNPDVGFGYLNIILISISLIGIILLFMVRQTINEKK